MAAPRHFRGADSDSEMADIEDEAYEAPQRYGYGPNALVPHDGAGSVNGEDDGGDGDDQHRERWSYVWLLDLLDRSFHDPSCITLAEAIRALPTSSLTQLRATLQRVLQLPHATSLDAEAWRRALSVFGLEVLRSLHPMLQQKLLRHLHDLEDHLQYWKEETRHPLRRFVERGPTHWLKASRGPQGVITQGFRAWLSRVAWTERTAATELLLDLELLKDGWLEEVGRLHEASDVMSGMDNFERDIEGFRVYGQAFHKAVGGAGHGAPLSGRTRATEFLRLCEDIIVRMEKFDTYVEVTLKPRKKPSLWERRGVAYVVTGVTTLFVGGYIFSRRRQIKAKATDVVKALSVFFQNHVKAPAVSVFRHIFTTFRPPEDEVRITSSEDVAVDKKALSTMLRTFAESRAAAIATIEGKSVDTFRNSVDKRADDGDMSLLMPWFASEAVQHPIRNVTGLTTGALLQAQQMKILSQAALLQLDRILQANEINVQLLAAIPAVATLGLTAYGVRRVRKTRRNRAVRGLEKHFRVVETVLLHACGAMRGLDRRQTGQLLLALHHADKLLPKLSDDTRRLVAADLELLRSCHLRPRIKLAVLHRMYSTYHFLQVQPE